MVAIAFVALQFAIPLVLWNQPHGFFQWRMYSEGADIRVVEVTDATGATRPVDYRSISNPRAEITPATWAAALCDFYDDAVTVIVDARSGVVEQQC